MSIADAFWYAWPWMDLGVGAVMLILLFGTDLLRGSGAAATIALLPMVTPPTMAQLPPIHTSSPTT